jgi:formylglycine-generating enzyme required for sulfatase activity
MKLRIWFYSGIIALVSSVSYAAPPLPATGTEFRDCAECPPMVVLPRENFTMGSPDSEDGRFPNEGPLHKVRISYALAVGKHEVTFEEWEACVADGGCDGHLPDDEGGGRGKLPVIDVDWFNAQAYAAWLSKKTGGKYRLLSEAEWEYAARAGAVTTYWWGPKANHEYANYGRDECCGGFKSGRDQWDMTSPAESFPPSKFGVHDMLGNVWEWVQDCWDESHADRPATGQARETGDCNRRIMRGGSWASMPVRIRAAFRDAYPPHDRGTIIGFRVARSE